MAAPLDAEEPNQTEEVYQAPLPSKSDLILPDLATYGESRVREEPEPEPKARNIGAKTSQEQTLFIFDWDDTLMPTTFLQMLSSNDIMPALAASRLEEVERSATHLLNVVAKMGRIVIITNSAAGWVEQSAEKYCPGLVPLLQEVPVISSRTKYERKFPGCVNKWKIEAFRDVLQQPSSENVTNIISIGDSQYDWEAAQALEEVHRDACVKNVKFKQMPSPVELSRELASLGEHLEAIVSRDHGLCVNLELKWSGSAQAFK